MPAKGKAKGTATPSCCDKANRMEQKRGRSQASALQDKANKRSDRQSKTRSHTHTHPHTLAHTLAQADNKRNNEGSARS